MSYDYNPDLQDPYMSSNQYSNLDAGTAPPSRCLPPSLCYPASQRSYNSGRNLNEHFEQPLAPYRPSSHAFESPSYTTAPHSRSVAAPSNTFDSFRWSPAPCRLFSQSLTVPNNTSESIIRRSYTQNWVRASLAPPTERSDQFSPVSQFSTGPSNMSDSYSQNQLRISPAPTKLPNAFRSDSVIHLSYSQNQLCVSPAPSELPSHFRSDSVIHPSYSQNQLCVSPAPSELPSHFRCTPAPSQAFTRSSTSFTDETDSIRVILAPERQISPVLSPLPDATKAIRLTCSSNLRGPALRNSSPTPQFHCAISFEIYCPDKKTKKKDPVWVCFRQPKTGCSVTFNPAKISWTTFKSIIKEEASLKYKHMGQKIDEGTESDPLTITWSAYILRNKDWPKSSPINIHEDRTFKSWMKEIVESRRKKGGIQLRKLNPQDELKQARKEDLLAKNVLKGQSRLASSSQSQRRGRGPDSNDKEENSSCDEYKDLELYIDQIYEKYAINAHYNPLLPSYPNQVDPAKYILLTNANVDVWAKAMTKRTPGVTLDSPPSSIKYESRTLASPHKQNAGLALSFEPLQLHKRK
ncbi:hypothetical protein PtA15_6A826 [Puccinia triticina]|uniref:Uncharacterized protein n=1 Tax=Puccinia triticina TaxID=208348 RepID=A0ABY7CM10_9BASI|nr:uncharacterized protein PtA15_6A826 [Puccinia triticina]WAQ86194.1 hypothetical protein PtA15_6A826 [Puccinia triticina]